MTKMYQNLVLSRRRSSEIKQIRELRKEAAAGNRQALYGLWKIGYQVITIGGRQINLRGMFEKPGKGIYGGIDQ